MRRNINERVEKLFKDKGYQKKYKYYYTLTFLIPILVILLTNTLNQETVKQQVIQSNEKILMQFFRAVDGNMKVMVEDTLSIVLEKDLAEYAELSASQAIVEYPKKVAIIDRLADYCENGNYQDVFVWFPRNDRILSGANPLSSSSVLQKYNDTYYTQFPRMQEILINLEVIDAARPVFWTTVGDNGERLFGVSLRRFRTDSNFPNYTVTLIVDKAFLDSYVSEGILSQQENAMLFNKDGELLFSYQKEELSNLPEQYRNAGVYETKENGTEMTLLVRESEYMDGYYVMSLPHQDFYQPLTKIRLVSIIGIVLSVVVGVFVVYRMSRNTYMPLALLLTQLQRNVDQQFDPKQQNEFEFLAQYLREQEKKQNARNLQKQKLFEVKKRESLLLASLEGLEIDGSDQSFWDQQMSMSKYLYGGILQVSSCGELGWKMISFVVSNVFMEILGEHYQCDILSVSPARYVIILGSESMEPEEHQILLLQKGMAFLKDKMGIVSIFGMAEGCRDSYGLRKMYRQAQYALEYKFLFSQNNVIKYRDICGRHMESGYFESNVLFHKINDFLQKEDLQKPMVNDFVRYLLKQYRIDTDSAIERVDHFRFEMLNILNRIWAGKDLESFKRQSYVEILMEADNLDQYQERLTQILHEVGTDMKENSRRKTLVTRIKRYVDDCYSNPNLNVMMIGDVFGMQGAYLSQIFRDEYGMLLPNYISYVRVMHAKKLLKESDITVVDISKETGFFSSAVFIKTFKKLVGVTPGKYRETHTSEDKF